MKTQFNKNAKYFWKSVFKIILIAFLTMLIPFLLDKENCVRDYSLLKCAGRYGEYLYSRMTARCFIVSNESFFPESNRLENIYLKLYLIDTNLTEQEITEKFQDVNTIWNRYSVMFLLKDVDSSMAGSKNIFEKLVSIESKIEWFRNNFRLDDEYSINIIITDEKIGSKGLHRNEESYQLIIIERNFSNLSWIIAHELGHVLGLWDKAFFSGELNLMTHGVDYEPIMNCSCIQDMYPTNLNRQQVETVLRISQDISKLQSSGPK